MLRNLLTGFVMLLLGFAPGSLAITPACAQSLQVSPIMVALQSGQMTTTLAVANNGDSSATVQLRPFEWDQTGGVDRLTPTSVLAVSPPITEIGAGQTQTFRLVLRRAASSVEASYRLLLDELPPAAARGTVGFALRLSIPVFAQPPGRLSASLSWRVSLDRGGAFLVGMNSGGQHVRILNPVLTQAPALRFAVQPGNGPYILPGAERSWRIQETSALRPGATLHLSALSEAGPVEATLHVAGP